MGGTASQGARVRAAGKLRHDLRGFDDGDERAAQHARRGDARRLLAGGALSSDLDALWCGAGASDEVLATRYCCYCYRLLSHRVRSHCLPFACWLSTQLSSARVKVIHHVLLH